MDGEAPSEPMNCFPVDAGAEEPAVDPIPEFPGDLCFAVSPEIYEWFPEFDQRLADAGEAWQITIVADDACRHRIFLELLSTSGMDYTMGRATYYEQDDRWDVRLNLGWVETDIILDITEEQCRIDYGGARVPLHSVLVHEFAHVLGVPGELEHTWCEWLTPTDEQLGMARLP